MSHDNAANDPVAAISSAAENMNQIREILFGEQLRGLDQRFGELEQLLHSRYSELSQELQTRSQDLERNMQEQLAALAELKRELQAGLRAVQDHMESLQAKASQEAADAHERLRREKVDNTSLAAILTELASRLTQHEAEF